MSQESNKRNETKPPRFNNRPGGGEDPQAPKKGPRFSIYWVYAIIFAVLIGFQLFGPLTPNMAKTNELELKNMIAKGEVEKYMIIDNRKVVRVYLTAAGIKSNEVKLKEVSGKIPEKGPHMSFKITSGDAFKKEMSDYYKENPTVQQVVFDVDNERDWFGGILQFLLPVLLLSQKLLYLIKAQK